MRRETLVGFYVWAGEAATLIEEANLTTNVDIQATSSNWDVSAGRVCDSVSDRTRSCNRLELPGEFPCRRWCENR